MPGMIDGKIIDDVRLRSDIVDVVGSYVTLQRSGSAFKTLCPFHKEKTPSFHVNPQRQIFHCFGCGAGGDVFKFVMQFEGVDFPTAIAMLAEKAGVRIEFSQGGEQRTSDKETLYAILEQVARFYHRCLLESDAGRNAAEYLKERDLPTEAVQQFMVGYAPDRWDSTLLWAKKHGYTPSKLEAAGLILKSARPGTGSDHYDRFRNRLMFPIRDTQGRVVGFSGRAIDPKDTGAKYVNTPETLLFHKSRILYGLHEARREIVNSREAIVCEGQIDVIRCHQAGFKTAVCPQGTALTEDQARIIRRSADSVVLAFDSDRAGRTAAVRSAGVLLQEGLAVRIAALPEQKDPDSFIREHGAAQFGELIGRAVSAVRFQIETMKSEEDLQSEKGVMRAAKAVLQTIVLTPNAVQRAKLTEEAASLLNIPVSALDEELRHAQQRSRPAARTDSGPAEKLDELPAVQMQLAEHIVADPELARLVETYLPCDMLHRHCAGIIKSVVTSAKEGRDLMTVVHGFDSADGELSQLVARVQMAPAKVTGDEFSREDAVKDIILYIWRHRMGKRRSELERQLGQNRTKKLEEEFFQLTCDIKAMKKWDTGSAIIEINLAE